MGYLVRMPQMGMSMEEGTVVEWTAEEGGEVEEGETVVVVESEKAEADVEARETGVLRQIIVEPGDVVEPGAPIGIVAGPDEDVAALEAEAEGATPGAGSEGGGGDTATTATESAGDDAATASTPEDVRATPGARQAAAEESVDLSAVEGTGPGGAITEADVEQAVEASGESTDGEPAGAEEVRATPGAKRLASEADVDLTAVEGTGPGGAITEDDVEGAAEAGGAEGRATAEGQAGLEVRERRSLSGIQETISERLSESYRNAVHVTLRREVEADALEEKVAEAGPSGADLSYNDFLLKAAGDALVDHPAFNAHFEDGEHVIYEDVNVGLAVDTGESLLTPVIEDVDAKDAVEVNEARTELTDRVTSSDYTLDDLQGGTFTISNLGAFGVDSFDPIIDPPQVAILGVGRVRDGTLTLSLSFDHRVVNGADAARFLDAIAGRLTDESSLAGYLP